MRYIKTYESNKEFIKGDIVMYEDEPFEITGTTDGANATIDKRKWVHLKSLIRDFKRNWTLDTDIRYLTDKEKIDLELKLRAIKYNL